ncbi:MAG: hypothetical protein C0406_04800 [Sideroxydans sp.]|nr:hypothetical protein [Sideroxydans sp.]
MKLTVFIVIVFTAWLTGCSLMLQDVASSRVAKLESSACPDLSGRYGQGEARVESASFPTKTEKDSVLHLIVLIPTDQEKVVDDIYEHFFDLNRPQNVKYRKEVNPAHPRRFDYRLDDKKADGAYVEFKSAGSNEYTVSVYSSDNQLVGSFLTKFSGANRTCYNGKYRSMADSSIISGPLHDGFMSMKRSLNVKDVYRSESKGLVIDSFGKVRNVIFGVVPFTTDGITYWYNFPSYSTR